MKATPISEKDIFEIECFGNSKLLYRFAYCNKCNTHYYKMDMRFINNSRICLNCLEKNFKRNYENYR